MDDVMQSVTHIGNSNTNSSDRSNVCHDNCYITLPAVAASSTVDEGSGVCRRCAAGWGPAPLLLPLVLLLTQEGPTVPCHRSCNSTMTAATAAARWPGAADAVAITVAW
jgi:hypothetical protein